MARTRLVTFIVTALVLSASAASAQQACRPAGLFAGSFEWEAWRARTLTDSGQAMRAPGIDRASTALLPCPDTAMGLFAIVPVRSLVQYRSDYADDRNDGALWSGAGVNASLSGGASLTWGPLSTVLAPVLLYEQNADFDINPTSRAGYPEFAYPFSAGLDWPQRQGIESRARIDPGQSSVQLNAYGFQAAISTENVWWGPALRYPLLFGSSAPGFVHVHAGTQGVQQTPIGGIEAQLMWGRLKESEFFDTISTNNSRQLSTIMVSWHPSFLPGLQVGATRIYHFAITEDGPSLGDYLAPWAELPFKDQLSSDDNPTGNDPQNQLAGVFIRMILPGSGFEAYWELARDDHSANMTDLLAQPWHAAGYTLGAQKVWQRDGGDLRVHVEHANVSNIRLPQAGRPAYSFYRHSAVRQGHTHRGSMLGLGTGPGSNASFLAADWTTDRFIAGGYAERVVRHDDHYFRNFAEDFSYYGQDMEWTLGARGAMLTGPFRLEATAAYSRRRNPNLLGLEAGNYTYLTTSNVLLETRLSWTPGLAARPAAR